MNHSAHALVTRMLADDCIAVPSSNQRRIESRLLQRSPRRDEEVELVLFNGHYVAIRDRRRPEVPERVINLAYLDPQPTYHAGDIIIRVSLVGLVSMLMIIVATVLQPQALLMVAVAAPCLLLLALMSARLGRWEFRTATGAISVCSVSRELFRHARPRRFVELLAERAEGAQIILPKGNKRLAAELAEHRRMLDSGWLSKRLYESARRRLLKELRHKADLSKVQLA
ncbi:hypothetical protein [Alcanivorax sp. 1008]|uniref:hypothetical protein n=1 Tax=Alcanivorax sp. 1008 TaxID=2816853 RepID=UPI001DE24F36|nr:hypothetical protein [Alcanivorax sp. 1008]MCC1497795.1 hypothetical protein [Alcanivorax sp. 1008]